MRIRKKMPVPGAAALVLAAALSLVPSAVHADMDSGDGGGFAVNLTLQQMTVQPVRAYVGDTVNVEVLIHSREEGSQTSWVELYAGKKMVARQMFRWGTPGASGTEKVNVQWDTRGMAPGEYKLKAEVFVYEDVDPFDNDLTLKQPVILAAAGGQFPGGAPAGGSATEVDPRYK